MELREPTVNDVLLQLRQVDSDKGISPRVADSLRGHTDEPMGWSDTHQWPWVCGVLESMKVVRQASKEVRDAGGFTALHYRNVTELTDLGREVRAVLRERQP